MQANRAVVGEPSLPREGYYWNSSQADAASRYGCRRRFALGWRHPVCVRACGAVLQSTFLVGFSANMLATVVWFRVMAAEPLSLVFSIGIGLCCRDVLVPRGA